MNISKLFVAALVATAVGASAATSAITLSGVSGVVQVKTAGGIMTVKAGEPIPVIPSDSEIVVVSGDVAVSAGGVTIKADAGDSFTVNTAGSSVGVAVTGGLVSIVGADGVSQDVAKGEGVTVAATAEYRAIPITVVAFGGAVEIVGPDGKALKPAKGLALPVGSTLTTGPASWIDLAQGGLSTVRVKAKTKSFSIQKSSLDKDGKATSLFKLTSGAAFVHVNKNALKPGSKYQVQMPEMTADVLGSEGEMIDGPGGCTVVCLGGSFVGNGMPIPPGSMMVDPVGDAGPSIGGAPDNVLAMCNATMDTLPVPVGGAADGSVTGGTAAGATPGADAFGAVAVPGASAGSALTTGTPALESIPADTSSDSTATTPLPSNPTQETGPTSSTVSPSAPL